MRTRDFKAIIIQIHCYPNSVTTRIMFSFFVGLIPATNNYSDLDLNDAE